MEIHSKPRSVVRNFFGTIGITKTALRKVLGKSFVDMETKKKKQTQKPHFFKIHLDPFQTAL